MTTCSAPSPLNLPLQELAGTHVGVIGLGRTGRAVVDVLVTLGARVSVYDARAQAVEALAQDYPIGGSHGVVKALSGSDADLAASLESERPGLAIVSPGVPATGPIFAAAARAGIELWSEIELAWRLAATQCPHLPWLAVTGTDGKTTTTGMLSAILTAAGLRAPAVGNIGVPTISVIAQGEVDALPVELSSFQLHTTRTLSPLAAVCLNVSSDHLDWHGSQTAYAADKARVYRNTQRGAIYNADEAATVRMVEEADVVEGCRAIGFTLGAPQRGQLGLVEDVLVDRGWHALRHTHGLEIATLADLAHLAPGGSVDNLPAHIVADALAAASMALACEAVADHPEAIAQGLAAYSPGAHRIVTVAQADGVTWVDDSKATNPHATQAALASMSPGSVVWLVGGDVKGADLSDLVAAVKDRVRCAVVLGKDPSPVLSACERAQASFPLTVIEDGAPEEIMERAVRCAAAQAKPGDTVLLAPAAASWDQFTSYAQRGDLFAQAAQRLTGASS